MNETKMESEAEVEKASVEFILNGVAFQGIIEQCEGCARICEHVGNKYCSAYARPAAKWALGNCNFSTHMKSSQTTNNKVNPLKASKRSAKGH